MPPAKPRGSFNRRINRPTYWLLLLGAAVVVGGLAALGVHAAYLEIAMVAIGVPRLHDIGRSGWIILGVIAAEFAIVIAAALLSGGEGVFIGAGIAVIAIGLLTIWLGCIPGQPHDNKWGPPPASGVNLTGKAADYGEVFE